MNGSISGKLSPASERAKLALSRQVYTLRPWSKLRRDPTPADSAKGSVAAGLDNCSRGPIYSGMRPRAGTAWIASPRLFGSSTATVRNADIRASTSRSPGIFLDVSMWFSISLAGEARVKLSDIYPPGGRVQRLYCDACHKHLDLTFVNFREDISGIDISIAGLPVLRCHACDRDYLPDRS